jgi:hypothetical protein
VSGAHINPSVRLGVDPSAGHTAARKNESVGTIIVDDGQLQISIERRIRDGVPHIKKIARVLGGALIQRKAM